MQTLGFFVVFWVFSHSCLALKVLLIANGRLLDGNFHESAHNGVLELMKQHPDLVYLVGAKVQVTHLHV